MQTTTDITVQIERETESNWLKKYATKFVGVKGTEYQKTVPLKSMFCSGLLSYIGILTISSIHHHSEIQAVIGSFGATAVLLYDATSSPLAQPRNLIGGHLLSAFVGVTVFKIFGNFLQWISYPLAVSLAIVVMDFTNTLHPPGGATSLIAVIGPKSIHDLGYLYILYPVFLSSIIMLLISVVGNNLIYSRQYPLRWY